MVRYSIPVLIALFVSVLVFGCRDYVAPRKVCCARPMPEEPEPISAPQRMSHICMALRAYHDEFGTLPPAYTRDESGQPLTSWRVLILPQLGYREIYAEYDHSQPWDSPTNLAWAEKTPTPYLDPQLKDAEPGRTSFVGIVGTSTPLNVEGSPGLSRLPDDLEDQAKMALIAQDLAHPVVWSQPVDRSPEEILGRETFRTEQSPYLNVGLANSNTWQFLDTNRHTLQKLLSGSGG